MRHWFEHTLESVYATSKYLCGENFANGLTMAILFVKSRVCPSYAVDDEEPEGPEVLIQAVVTQVRDPPLFRYDVKEQVMNTFVEQGMLT
jgi:hypothetical protein